MRNTSSLTTDLFQIIRPMLNCRSILPSHRRELPPRLVKTVLYTHKKSLLLSPDSAIGYIASVRPQPRRASFPPNPPHSPCWPHDARSPPRQNHARSPPRVQEPRLNDILHVSCILVPSSHNIRCYYNQYAHIGCNIISWTLRALFNLCQSHRMDHFKKKKTVTKWPCRVLQHPHGSRSGQQNIYGSKI